MSSKPSSYRKAWDDFKAFYLRQFVSLFWMLLAVGIGLVLRESVPWLEENIDFPLMALISGIIGIMIPNLAQFGNAGKVLTKSENRSLNLLVGAAVTVIASFSRSTNLNSAFLNFSCHSALSWSNESSVILSVISSRPNRVSSSINSEIFRRSSLIWFPRF